MVANKRQSRLIHKVLGAEVLTNRPAHAKHKSLRNYVATRLLCWRLGASRVMGTVTRDLALLPRDLTLPEKKAEVLTLRCWDRPNGKRSNSKCKNQLFARGKIGYKFLYCIRIVVSSHAALRARRTSAIFSLYVFCI